MTKSYKTEATVKNIIPGTNAVKALATPCGTESGIFIPTLFFSQ